MQILQRISAFTLALHSALTMCVFSGSCDMDNELLLLMLVNQLPLAASLFGAKATPCCRSFGLANALILCYVLGYADSPAEKILGVCAVHLGGFSGLAEVKLAWRLWSLLLLAIVIAGFTAVVPCQFWDMDLLLCLCTAWVVTATTLVFISYLLDLYLQCRRDLEAERDYSQVLQESVPFTKVATCRLRGCPSLYHNLDEELKVQLMSANNPVVVQSSASFDELFGKYMQGLSLDKKCVAHHQGRQDLKGLFCQEKHDKDLTVTFIDSEGNDFDCRVLVPAEMYKPNKDGSPKSRELLVGLSLMGQKRKRLELPETDRVVKSKSLPSRQSSPRRTRSKNNLRPITLMMTRSKSPTALSPTKRHSESKGAISC